MQWAEETANKGGRVIEILSEHTCQGFRPHLPPCHIETSLQYGERGVKVGAGIHADGSLRSLSLL